MRILKMNHNQYDDVFRNVLQVEWKKKRRSDEWRKVGEQAGTGLTTAVTHAFSYGEVYVVIVFYRSSGGDRLMCLFDELGEAEDFSKYIADRGQYHWGFCA